MKTVKSIIGFTEEEQATIIAAGKLFREVSNQLESTDPVLIELDDQSVNLINAMKDVLNKINIGA